MNNYILDGHRAIVEPDLLKWAKWFESGNRRVDEAKIGDVRVSTVFLGIDISFDGGKKQLFETMIFGGANDEYCNRCETWDEAVKMHKIACDLVND